jgi:shikimate kinase
MDSTRHIRNLALIGFMGTGKSSVGRLVASNLHFTFLDTEDVIAVRAMAKIVEILTH